MLYNLLYPLSDQWTLFNLFKYITFRSIGAVLTALFLSFLIGPWMIATLRRLQSHGQPIREDGPERHLLEKKGTPTMGGALILFSIIIPTLLWADLTNPFVWVVLLVTAGYGAIGLWDDMLKLIYKNPKGVPGKVRLTLQIFIAAAAGYFLYGMERVEFGAIYFPFFKNLTVELGVSFILFAMVVIAGSGNAVNLTDGLDGLAIGPTFIAAGTFAIISYVTGHHDFAKYLGIPFVPGAGELMVFCGAMVGAALGFLWFNTYPAQVFMGDVGALGLGGALGSVAVVTKHEIVWAIVGGVFVMETLSVVVQVISFKLVGKRVFRMAPIHHHFELKGWAEPKIIVRFWIISVILGLIGLATLKIR